MMEFSIIAIKALAFSLFCFYRFILPQEWAKVNINSTKYMQTRPCSKFLWCTFFQIKLQIFLPWINFGRWGISGFCWGRSFLHFYPCLGFATITLKYREPYIMKIRKLTSFSASYRHNRQIAFILIPLKVCVYLSNNLIFKHGKPIKVKVFI